MPFIDTVLFEALNGRAANALLDALFPVLTSLHQNRIAVAIALLVCVWMVTRGPRQIRIVLLCLALSVGTADLVASKLIKRLADRDRPCHVVAGVHAYPSVRLAPKADCPGSGSFPSNHAANTMAFACVAWAATRRLGTARARRQAAWWYLLPLLVGYTRIYLGYHYPSDVAAGWVFGSLVGACGVALLNRWTGPGKVHRPG